MEETLKGTEQSTLVDKEREALIAEMLREANPVELPSELLKNPVIHTGKDETLQAPMVVNKISSAGYVYIWETDTYEKVPVLYYMLAQKLRQRRPDGGYRFTTVNPGKLPKRGTIKCMLNKEAEDRKHYDDLGFRVCPKANITNQYQLQQHMKKRHPQEWAAIDAEKKEKEKAEDRALQRLLLTNQLNTMSKPKEESKPEIAPAQETIEEKAPLYVSEKDKKKVK